MRLSKMPAATSNASLPVLSRLRPVKAPGFDMNIHCPGFSERLWPDYPELMTAEMLRAKYGPPHGRKFTISPGFEIAVEYGLDGQVRKIELPGTAPDETGASTAHRIDEVLLDLVPMSMRGKEIGSGQWRLPYYTKHKLYEHVWIFEAEDPWVLDQRHSLTVVFPEHHQSNSIS